MTFPSGPSTTVYGTADCHVGSKAACKLAVSSDAKSRLRLVACFFWRKRSTLGSSSGILADTVTMSKSRPLYMRYVSWRSGHSTRQDPHHVAQKSIKVTWPLGFERNFF